MAIDLHNDLLALRRDLLALSALVEQQVSRTIEAMTKSDAELAREVKGSDAEVDAMDLRIEEQCMRLLALGSPMAGDLRRSSPPCGSAGSSNGSRTSPRESAARAANS